MTLTGQTATVPSWADAPSGLQINWLQDLRFCGGRRRHCRGSCCRGHDGRCHRDATVCSSPRASRQCRPSPLQNLPWGHPGTDNLAATACQLPGAATCGSGPRARGPARGRSNVKVLKCTGRQQRRRRRRAVTVAVTGGITRLCQLYDTPFLPQSADCS